MYPRDIDPDSGCRQPLPRREELDELGSGPMTASPTRRDRAYGASAVPAASCCTAPRWRAIPGRSTTICGTRQVSAGRVRELAILTTARELDS